MLDDEKLTFPQIERGQVGNDSIWLFTNIRLRFLTPDWWPIILYNEIFIFYIFETKFSLIITVNYVKNLCIHEIKTRLYKKKYLWQTITALQKRKSQFIFSGIFSPTPAHTKTSMKKIFFYNRHVQFDAKIRIENKKKRKKYQQLFPLKNIYIIFLVIKFWKII